MEHCQQQQKQQQQQHSDQDAMPQFNLCRKGEVPIACIVIGMAGSGKSSLMQRLVSHNAMRKRKSYVVNLDPAVSTVPYDANIDIRDTVNYKEVIKSYNLGPNGAIVTSLNLFSTRFEQVIDYAEKKADSLDHVLLDTPGQIEVFTWSASGTIITDSLATAFPTVIVYVIDTPRSSNPITFMSNMMYACSILYKTKLPFLIVFNKIDVASHQFAIDWINDIEVFEEALRSEQSYMSTLTRSMGFMLDQFYSTIKCVGVSALTGEGIDDFFSAVDSCADEYFDLYQPLLRDRYAKHWAARQQEKEKEMAKVREELDKDGAEKTVLDASVDSRGTAQKKQEYFVEPEDVPFDNFDYEQDRRDFEEYMADLKLELEGKSTDGTDTKSDRTTETQPRQPQCSVEHVADKQVGRDFEEYMANLKLELEGNNKDSDNTKP